MEKVIVCFGDSNTWGFDASTCGRFSKDIRYPRVLEKRLNARSSDIKYRVIEEGLSGRTFAFDDPISDGLSGVDYISPCLRSHDPIDLLIIMLGTNDTKERFSATARNIAQAAERLIDIAKSLPVYKSGKPNILLIAPARIEEGCEDTLAGKAMGSGCELKSVQLITELKKSAVFKKCHFLNSDEFIKMNEIDYMHFTEESHLIMAEKLSEIVPELMRPY